MVPMIPTPSSSQVHSYSYDPTSQTLAVIYKSSPNKRYDHNDVPAEIGEDAGKAESIGKFLGANVRGKFTFSVVELEADPVDEEAKA